MTLRSCVLQPVAEQAIGSVSQVRFNGCRLGVSPVGGGLPLCLCARVQPRLRSLYQYTMCKRITEPVARTVGVSSEL